MDSHSLEKLSTGKGPPIEETTMKMKMTTNQDKDWTGLN